MASEGNAVSVRTCLRCKTELLEVFPKYTGRICRECKNAHNRAYKLKRFGPRPPRKKLPTCLKCKTVKRSRDFYPEQKICKTCTNKGTKRERKPKPKTGPTGPRLGGNGYNSVQSDRLDNTWDLGVLSKRDQLLYFRGVWVGWKRGLDSYSTMGSGDGNTLANFLSQVLASVGLPDELKAKLYATGRRLAPDFLPARTDGDFRTLRGEKAPESA